MSYYSWFGVLHQKGHVASFPGVFCSFILEDFGWWMSFLCFMSSCVPLIQCACRWPTRIIAGLVYCNKTGTWVGFQVVVGVLFVYLPPHGSRKGYSGCQHTRKRGSFCLRGYYHGLVCHLLAEPAD